MGAYHMTVEMQAEEIVHMALHLVMFYFSELPLVLT